MIKKRNTCLYCGEKMDSVTAKKKFCSDVHRVYYNREQKQKLKGENVSLPIIKKSDMASLAKFVTTKMKPEQLTKELKMNLIRNPVMSVPKGLSSIQRQIWISDFKKKNKIK